MFRYWAMAGVFMALIDERRAHEISPLHGKSACAYSGQQDDPVGDAGTFKGNRTQSWGQVLADVKVILIALGLHPGQACNPTKSAGEP